MNYYRRPVQYVYHEPVFYDYYEPVVYEYYEPVGYYYYDEWDLATDIAVDTLAGLSIASLLW